MSRSSPYGYGDDRGYDGYRRGDREPEGPPRDRPSDGARERERPTRTLFVRSIPYEATHNEVHELFSTYGKVARIFDLIQKRGMAFITYYDLRHADRAKRSLQNHKLHGREINIHYSLPREEEHGAPVSEDDPTRAVSSIFVLIRDPTSDVTNQDVQDLFSQWGEVKEVRDGRGKTVITKFVDYWDTRDAVVACKAANDMPFKGGRLEARFALTPGKLPSSAMSRPEREHTLPHRYEDPRYDDHGNDRSRGDPYTHPPSGGQHYDAYRDSYHNAQVSGAVAPPSGGYVPPGYSGGNSNTYPSNYQPQTNVPPANYAPPQQSAPYPGGQQPPQYPPLSAPAPAPGTYVPAPATGVVDEHTLLAQIMQLQNLLSQQQGRPGAVQTPQPSNAAYPPPQAPSYTPPAGTPAGGYPPPSYSQNQPPPQSYPPGGYQQGAPPGYPSGASYPTPSSSSPGYPPPSSGSSYPPSSSSGYASSSSASYPPSSSNYPPPREYERHHDRHDRRY